MAIDLKSYAKEIEETIARMRDDLKPLEDGKMTIGERVENGPWRDITKEQIEHDRGVIRTYETILSDLRARLRAGSGSV